MTPKNKSPAHTDAEGPSTCLGGRQNHGGLRGVGPTPACCGCKCVCVCFWHHKWLITNQRKSKQTVQTEQPLKKKWKKTTQPRTIYQVNIVLLFCFGCPVSNSFSALWFFEPLDAPQWNLLKKQHQQQQIWIFWLQIVNKATHKQRKKVRLFLELPSALV